LAKKGVYIDRDKIVNFIRKEGTKVWEDFSAIDLIKVGNSYRCTMNADGKTAKLNLFFNKDGTTTITPTGNNKDISSQIKFLLEKNYAFTNDIKGKTYIIKNLSKQWTKKLIDYLSNLENITLKKHDIKTSPVHKSYIFTSKIGDKLTINIYSNGSLTLQGKPAYLYGEAISFLSYCKDISIDDIVNSLNCFYNVNVEIDEIYNDMKSLMPNAYKNIDKTILKLLSPSISLRRVNIELEDYSCYSFSALRALEGYIKYLFRLKNIPIGNTFADVFKCGSIEPETAKKICNETFCKEVEKLYKYYRNTRHVIFHADQTLILTTILDTKTEADEIVNKVINLIETSYTNIYT